MLTRLLAAILLLAPAFAARINLFSKYLRGRGPGTARFVGRALQMTSISSRARNLRLKTSLRRKRARIPVDPTDDPRPLRTYSPDAFIITLVS